MAFRIPSDRPARVIGAGNIDYGRSVPASQAFRQGTIPYITGTVAGMEAIQVSRDDPISHRSLAAAVFFEHRTLSVMDIVSTPFVAHLNFFDDDEQDTAFEAIERDFEGNHAIHHHPIFNGVSEREFTIFNFRIDGGYAMIVARIRAMDPPHQHDAEAGHFFNREITDFAILDPRDDEFNQARRDHILNVARLFFREGSIQFAPGMVTHQMRIPTVGDDALLTGYVCYGITRELIRRLRVVVSRRAAPVTGLVRQANPAFFWDDIEEDWTVDTLRQAILGADALRAVQMSNYQAYIALVVPSEVARLELQNLSPPRLIRDMLPDENFWGFDDEGPPLTVDVTPNGPLPSPAASEIGVPVDPPVPAPPALAPAPAPVAVPFAAPPSAPAPPPAPAPIPQNMILDHERPIDAPPPPMYEGPRPRSPPMYQAPPMNQNPPPGSPPPYAVHNVFHAAIDTPIFFPVPAQNDSAYDLPKAGDHKFNAAEAKASLASEANNGKGKAKGKRSISLFLDSDASSSDSSSDGEYSQQPAPKRQRKTPSPTPSQVRRSGRIAKR